MSEQAMVDHIKRLDYLYCAAMIYRELWLAETEDAPRNELWRRYRWARDRYVTAQAEGKQRFGSQRMTEER